MMTVNHLLMPNRIRLEKQNKPNDQVTELILDNCQAAHISGLTEEFVNLQALSIINVGLVTLKGFPKLPNLKRLELCDNRLSEGLNLLLGCPKLQELNLSGNSFKDLSKLEPLKGLQNLINLDLFNCEISNFGDYRQKVFDLLPNIQMLDGFERSEKEPAPILSPVEQTKPIDQQTVEKVDKVCLSKEEDTSMVVESVGDETTGPIQRNDTSMVIESVIKETSNIVKDNTSIVTESVIKEVCHTKPEDTPMNVESNIDENVSCSEKETLTTRLESINEDFVCSVKEGTSLKENNANEDTASSEKEDDPSTIEVDTKTNTNICEVQEDDSLSKESEIQDSVQDSVQDSSIESVENADQDTSHREVGNTPPVEDSDQQDPSIIEISADHDSSNEYEEDEEEEAESSENAQDLTNEEEDDLTGSSSDYEYIEDAEELEEGECADDDEEELNDTQNQTNEISSGEEDEQSDSSEVQDDSGELQEEPSQVLQELSGMRDDYSEMQEAESGHAQGDEVGEEKEVEGEGDRQSEDVEN